MSLRVIAYNVNVTGAKVKDGGDLPANKDGNATVVDTGSAGGNVVQIKIDNDTVDVPPINDGDRTRGWAQLSGPGNVLAYRVGEDKVVLFRQPDLRRVTSDLPDDRALADVTLPGTHESASLSGGFISQCQNVDVAQQLRDGVRVFDIRLKNINGELQTYHGIQPEHSNLDTQVGWINDFLRDNPRETVICSIKQEADDNQEFPGKIEDILKASGQWRFDETLPQLGDVRGKAILFSRYHKVKDEQYPNGMGLHPTSWPDNNRDGFEWDCYGTPFRTHDWYDMDNIDQKSQAIAQHLEPTLSPRGSGTGNNHPYTWSYTTAAKFPQAPPQWIACGKGSGGLSNALGAGAALLRNITSNFTQVENTDGARTEGVNSRITRWLLERAVEGRRPRATLLLDFYKDNGSGDAGVAALMVALNQIPE